MLEMQAKLVQSTICLVNEKMIMKFYEQLFTDNPILKKIFKGDMERQSSVLFNMLFEITNSCTDLQEDTLRFLGEKHKKYGVRKEYYGIFCSTLLDTFAKELGDKFTLACRAAWERLLFDVVIAMCTPK